MPNLTENLKLDRCPHCGTANPNLKRQHHLETHDHAGQNYRIWSIYVCGSCGGVVSAWAAKHGQPVGGYHPTFESIDLEIPERPRAYLKQAS